MQCPSSTTYSGFPSSSASTSVDLSCFLVELLRWVPGLHSFLRMWLLHCPFTIKIRQGSTKRYPHCVTVAYCLLMIMANYSCQVGNSFLNLLVPWHKEPEVTGLLGLCYLQGIQYHAVALYGFSMCTAPWRMVFHRQQDIRLSCLFASLLHWFISLVVLGWGQKRLWYVIEPVSPTIMCLLLYILCYKMVI